MRVRKVIDDDGVFIRQALCMMPSEAIERVVLQAPGKEPRAMPLSSALREPVSSNAHPLTNLRCYKARSIELYLYRKNFAVSPRPLCQQKKHSAYLVFGQHVSTTGTLPQPLRSPCAVYTILIRQLGFYVPTHLRTGASAKSAARKCAPRTSTSISEKEEQTKSPRTLQHIKYK